MNKQRLQSDIGYECHRMPAFSGGSATAVFLHRSDQIIRKNVFNIVDFLIFNVFNILFGVCNRM